ncbi:hypothetical protein GCM10009662_81400 [Catellatospora coxensis]|uniref:Uncharacterized protein n=1 Tax=Catellatospora coxensis TaxID=310354 RepID=A0A8J3KY88_9ACTN|nr:hypothetical protein Cco03nite_76130 [Catellatospora coxensis]
MRERLRGDLQEALAVALRVGAQGSAHGSSFQVVTQLIVRIGVPVAKRRMLRLAWSR